MNEKNPGVARLEAELDRTRAHALRATREVHAIIAADLESALARLESAERRVVEAQDRIAGLERQLARTMAQANAVEQQLSALRGSATWKAGRVVVAVPGRIRRVMKNLRT